MIVLPNELPPEKQICERAKANGVLCTTDKCDHSGAFLLMLFSDGGSFRDDNINDCKACGAEAPTPKIFEGIT